MRPWAERKYDPADLVVAKPGRIGGGRIYAPGQRFRPDREAVPARRVRQMWEARTLVSAAEYRRLGGTIVEPAEETAPEPPAQDDAVPAQEDNQPDIDAMDDAELRRRLRDVGVTPGPRSSSDLLRAKLRAALEA